MNPAERAMLALIFILIVVVTVAACLVISGYHPTKGVGSW